MKRFAICVLALSALASCAKEERMGGTEGAPELRLASGIEVMTRGDVQSTEIVPGETVHAWVFDAGNGEALYNAVGLTAQAGGALSGEPMYFPRTGHAVHVRALHGRFAEGAPVAPGTAFPKEGIGFEVAVDQSRGGDAYVQSDLLYAALNDVARTKSAVGLTFYHMLSKFELEIVRGAGLTDEIVSVTLDGVAVKGTFTPKEGAALDRQNERAAMITADETQVADMQLGTVADAAQTNDAIVVPQSVAGKTLTFRLAGGGELVYTFPRGKAFESGKRHLYKVTLTLTGLQVTSNISPWDDSEACEEGEATQPRVARIGDFFYADGTFSTELDPAKTVIGIVFQTDPARIGDAEKESLQKKGIARPNGLVLSVKKVSNGSQWNRDKKYAGSGDLCLTKADCEKEIDGLRNYNTVIALAEKESNLFMYPAFEAVKNYDVAAPENTTGWYLPAAGQWYDVFANLGGLPGWDKTNDNSYIEWADLSQAVAEKLNARLKLIGEGKYDEFRNNSDQWFWTSSVYGEGKSWRWGLLARDVRCLADNQDYSCIVRAVLAF